MAGDNYKAWLVDIPTFDNLKTVEEKLRFLLKFAVLAPSSHNSQPWSFHIENNSIKIYADRTRSLPASDSNNRQLLISLGCALENILTAAGYYGYKVETTLFPNSTDDFYIASINLTEIPNSVRPEHHAIFTIAKRHANRTKYDARLPEKDFIQWVESLASDGTQIAFVTEKAKKDAIADVVIEAGIAAMQDSGFRRELSQYVKNNYTSSPVGMPLYGFGVPGPVSLIAPFMMKHINMNKVNAKTDTDMLKNHTPAIALRAYQDEKYFKAGMKPKYIATDSRVKVPALV